MSLDHPRFHRRGLVAALLGLGLLAGGILPAAAQEDDVAPAPPSIGADIPLTYFGPAPSTVQKELIGPHQLLRSGTIDLDAGTIELPLYRGQTDRRDAPLVHPDRHHRPRQRRRPRSQPLGQARLRRRRQRRPPCHPRCRRDADLRGRHGRLCAGADDRARRGGERLPAADGRAGVGRRRGLLAAGQDRERRRTRLQRADRRLRRRGRRDRLLRRQPGLLAGPRQGDGDLPGRGDGDDLADARLQLRPAGALPQHRSRPIRVWRRWRARPSRLACATSRSAATTAPSARSNASSPSPTVRPGRRIRSARG